MENRDRDKLNKNIGSTESDDSNRSTSERKGRTDSDSNADFGEKIGQSEEWDSEPSRRSGNLDDVESGSEIGSSGRGGNVGVGSDRSRRSNSGSEH